MSLPTTDNTTTTTAASSYAEIRKQIERARLTPWSSAPAMRIGSFVVNPLCFRSLIDLELSGNAFTLGDEPIAGDVAAYIWRHMPEFTPSADSSAFLKQVAKENDIDGMIAAIYSHISNPFDETPTGSNFGGVSIINTIPAIPSIAAICHEYGAAYGIDPRAVADIDLRIVFQCCRAIRVQTGTKYSEPKRLRQAKSELLKSHG